LIAASNRRARETVLEREAIAKQQEEAERKKVEELESRKKESRELVGETIRREMAERAWSPS
jgi:microfibrillar-associated protein 1